MFVRNQQSTNNGGMPHVQGLQNSTSNRTPLLNTPQRAQFGAQNAVQFGRTNQGQGGLLNFTQQMNFSNQQHNNMPNQQCFNYRNFQPNVRPQQNQNQTINYGNQCVPGTNVLQQNANRVNFQQGFTNNLNLQYQQGLANYNGSQRPTLTQQTNVVSGQNNKMGQSGFVLQANQISAQLGFISQANQISRQSGFASQVRPGIVFGGNQTSGQPSFVPQVSNCRQPIFVGTQQQHVTGQSQQGVMSNYVQQNNNTWNWNQHGFNQRNQNSSYPVYQTQSFTNQTNISNQVSHSQNVGNKFQTSWNNPASQSQSSANFSNPWYKSYNNQGNQLQSPVQNNNTWYQSQKSVYNQGSQSHNSMTHTFNSSNQSQSSGLKKDGQSKFNITPSNQSQYNTNQSNQSQFVYNQDSQSQHNSNSSNRTLSSVHNKGNQSQHNSNSSNRSLSSVHNQGSQSQHNSNSSNRSLSSVHNQDSQSQYNTNPSNQTQSSVVNQSNQSTKPGNQSQNSVSKSEDHSKDSQTQNITNNPIIQSQRSSNECPPQNPALKLGNQSQNSGPWHDDSKQSAQKMTLNKSQSSDDSEAISQVSSSTPMNQNVQNSGNESQSSINNKVTQANVGLSDQNDCSKDKSLVKPVSDERKSEKISANEKKDSNSSKSIVPKIQMLKISEKQQREKIERKIKSGRRNSNVLINLTGTKSHTKLVQCRDLTNQSSVVDSDNSDKEVHLTSQERAKVTGSKLNSKQGLSCENKEVNQSSLVYQENQHSVTETRDKGVRIDSMNNSVLKSDEPTEIESHEDRKNIRSYDIDSEKNRDMVVTDQLSKNLTEISLSEDVEMKQDEIPSKTYEIAKNISVLISRLSEENLKKSPVKSDTSGISTRKHLKPKSTKCVKKSHEQATYQVEKNQNFNVELKTNKSAGDSIVSEGNLNMERHGCKSDDTLNSHKRIEQQYSQTSMSKGDNPVEAHRNSANTIMTINETCTSLENPSISLEQSSEIPVSYQGHGAACRKCWHRFSKNIDRTPKGCKTVPSSEVETVDKENLKEAGSNKEKEICASTSTEKTNSQGSTTEDCITLINDEEGLGEDKSDEMYPRYNYQNYPERERNDYYNPRREVGPQYRTPSYNSREDYQYVSRPRERGYPPDSRTYVENSYHGENRNVHYDYSDYGGESRNVHHDYSDYSDESYSNYQDEYYARPITGRPPINQQRYYEGQSSGSRSYENVNYDRRNDYWNKNMQSRPQNKYQNSQNVERYQSKYESQKSQESAKKFSSKTPEKPKNELHSHETSPSQNKDKDKEQQGSKVSTENTKEISNTVKSPESTGNKSSKETSPSTNTSQQQINLGCTVYQSDQYFSAQGHPEKISPSKNISTKPRSAESSDKTDLDKSPYRNLKRHSSDLGKSPKSTSKNLTESEKEQSPSNRSDKEKTPPVKRTMSDTSPSVSMSSQQLFAKAKDKMDFSSIKKALSEVKNKQDVNDQSKCADDKVEKWPIHSKNSSESPIHRKNSSESPIRRKNSSESPIHRNSSSENMSDKANSQSSPIHRKSSSENMSDKANCQSSPIHRKSSSENMSDKANSQSSPIHRKSSSENMSDKANSQSSPIQIKSSTEKMQTDSGTSQAQVTVNNPTIPVLLHKQSSSDETKNPVNNPVLYHQRKSSFEKVQSSPRSRSSSGDSHGMLSPKSVSEHKQRSAFHSVHIHTQLSEPSQPSQEIPLSPHDRKRRISDDLKSNKQNVIGSPAQKEAEVAWPTLQTETFSSPDISETNISLKSATSYREWKRLKAIQDAAIQKEQERIRPCIELANTPEEYRKLLQQRKQESKEARQKTKASKSTSENDKSMESDIDPETTQLPSLHNTQNSFQTIQDTVETGVSDDDIDLEDSDDDDLEAPSFLFSLEEASTRPIPGTPTKLFSNIESPGPASPLPEPDLTDITKKTLLSSKFSLDQLVSEKNDKSVDQRALEDMHAKLEEGLKKGGFIKDTLEEPVETIEELLPEQQNVVQKIFDSVISEVHPGEIIFQPILYQSLFTGSLSLQTCGFSPGTSYIDKYLSQLQPNNYSLLLTSNILKNTLETVSCVESVLRWLFLLMSVHSNQLVTQGCHKALLEHLNRQVHFKQVSQTWVPTIPDVLAVFCNYGCDVNTILPDTLINSSEDLSAGLIREEMNGNVNQGGHYNLRNLHLILNVIGQALHASPRYSNRQLTELLIILCRVALDKSHHSEILPHEFQVCIKGVLRCYTCNYWENNCNELCHTLFRITTHHHNRLYLAQIFPEDKRGSYIQRRLSYLFLQDMFDVGRDTDIKDFRIKCLHVFLPKLHTLVTTDVYQLASAISYLDLAVGNSSIKISDKEDLQYLSDQLKKISGDIKDSVRMLDRSWVKDMMVRICSKWTLYLLSVGSKQRSIFVYARKKTPAVKIKEVEAVQEDISSQSEGEEESKGVQNDNKTIERNNSNEIDYEIIDENSNMSDSKTIQSLKQETHTREVSNELGQIVTVKVESPIPIINCDSPMEVDLTLDDGDDLPDLL